MIRTPFVNRWNRRTLGQSVAMAALVALPAAAARPAMAQTPPDPVAAPALEEIVVTARRREENLQETPLSVVAFSAEGLETRQITNVAEIGNFTPNLILDSAASLAGSSGTVTAYIRGIGQSDFNLTIDPGVGMYLDGVYVSRSVGALLDTVDLARVEVLRGPQGTLFGKNTIGGAVVLTSKQPEDTFSASLDVATGSYSRLDAKAVVNVPINDVVAVRATGSTQNRDGYVRRLSDGERMGNRNSDAARLQARIDASDTLTFSLSADVTRSREEAKPATLLAVNPVSEFVGFWNFALNGADCFTPPAGLPVPDLPNCFTDRFITGDPFTTVGGGPNFSDLDLWGVNLTVDWVLGAVDLKSVTAYRDLESSFYQDYDNSPLPVGETGNDYTQEQFSQEFQLSGTGFDGRLSWLAGVFYLKETGDDENRLIFSIADFLSGGEVDNDSYAAFTQISYDLTDRLSLTLGARYTDETKRFLPDQQILVDRTGGSLLVLSRLLIPQNNPDGNLILPRVEESVKAEEFTPMVSVDYQAADDVLLYASYSQGFKSGGFTQRVFPPEPVVPSFGPETVKSYEAGAKTRLFDRRVRLNGAVFYADYTGLQIIVNEGVAPKVRNAGEAHVKGFELDLEAALHERLTISGGVGLTDAEYDEVDTNAVGITADNDFANVPRWTATAGASVTMLETGLGRLFGRVDWSYRSGHFKDAVNSPEIYQDAYHLVGASVTFEALDGDWSITAGASNLTDETYLITGYQDLATVGVATGTYARPREWFLRGRIRF